MTKPRWDVNVTPETSRQINEIIEEQKLKAQQEDLAPRSNSQVVEMLIRKGIRTYRQNMTPQASPSIPNHP